MSNRKYVTGTLVRISENSEFYRRGNTSNPKDTAGIVVQDDRRGSGDYFYDVRWANGTSNHYREKDLKYLSDE